MTLIVGATAVDKVFFNGVELEKVYMNGVLVFEGTQQVLLTIATFEGGAGYNYSSEVGAITSRSIEGYGGELLKLVWTNDADYEGSLLEIDVSRVAPDISQIRVTIGPVTAIVSLSERGPYMLGGQVYYPDNPFTVLPIPGPVVVKLEAIA